MRHIKTPSDHGWYWIANQPDSADGWNMAYWDAEAPTPTLYVYDPQAATVLGPNFGIGIWKPLEDGSAHHWQDGYGTWSGPEVWIGPLSQPGGPFGGCIVEADEDLHAKAMERKGVIVIEHKDFTHSELSGGTFTACKIIEGEGSQRDQTRIAKS